MKSEWFHVSDVNPQLPYIEWSNVPQELTPENGEVRFGYLYVPEKHNRSKNPKIIKLAIAIIKSTKSNPKSDPILYTTGDPGVLSTVRAVKYAYKVPFIVEMLKERDFILFEQRGAKYSTPNLVAPEIDSIYLESVENNINAEPDKKKLIKTVEDLKQRFEGKGIDLTAYNSSESAADIEDLRNVLKIEKWNLIGISNSCRLMLEVYRYYPEGVRTMVLDSPLPPDANWHESSFENYWSVIDRLFERCKMNPELNHKYPDLKEYFLKFLSEVDQNPIDIKTEHPKSQLL
jgi:pimeloyl-ACP methyl ester carboxylesterase